jgi:hypothetical protein
MAYDYSSIMAAQWERLNEEAAQTAADLEAARQREDTNGTMYAAQRILQIDAERDALARRANQYAQQQAYAQQHSNRYGLSDQEIEVAKNSHGHGTVEERVAEYAANKQKYQHMRATGQYRDDQGTVKR